MRRRRTTTRRTRTRAELPTSATSATRTTELPPPAPAAHPDARANATPAAPPGAGAASVAASDGHENDEDDGAPDERNERDEVRRRCRWWDPRCTRGCAHCKKKADGVTCKANCPFAPTSCTHLGNDVFVVYQRGAGDEFTDP